MSFALSLFAIISCVPLLVVQGYPSGAPAGACSSLTPMHGDHVPQTSDIPFMIDISNFESSEEGCYYYQPGETYNISLVATGTVEFEGYIIQGRLVSNTDTIVGTFSEPESGRFHSCNPRYGGVTHNHHEDDHDDDHEENHVHDDDDEGRSISFQWTAPAQGTGSFFFRFTVVEHFDTFWANAETAEIYEGECRGSGAGQVAALVSVLLFSLSLVFSATLI